MSWTADPLERRRAERDRLLARAREHVEGLARRMPVAGAAVVGSVARGDFNVWSDVDIVVVSDALPAPGLARAEALGRDAPPGLELHGYTLPEFVRAIDRGDRLAREAMERGVILVGALPRVPPRG
jgi:predicted nucleotidyltransferase